MPVMSATQKLVSPTEMSAQVVVFIAVGVVVLVVVVIGAVVIGAVAPVHVYGHSVNAVPPILLSQLLAECQACSAEGVDPHVLEGTMPCFVL